ncbi:MAG: hypothetical protein ABSB71_07905 [Candidatus Bathyarchaeia archaeon]|jgi:hypothetical protein
MRRENDQEYFAFILHEGVIEIVYWVQTEQEANAKVAEWKKSQSEGLFDPESDVRFFVGQILFNPKETREVKQE